MDTEILTVDQAAAMLHVSPDMVMELLLSNELPGRSLGGQWLTTKRAVVNFVDGGVPVQMSCCPSDGCCTPAMAGEGATFGSGRRCC